MPAGRPTKYTPELLKKAQEYLDGGYKDQDGVIPSTVGLALCLDITRTTMHDWSNQPEKVEFSNILDAIQKKQESLLLNSGLSGAFNPAITKLVLGKHGYKEQKETDNKHTHDFSGMTDEQLRAITNS